MALLTQAVAASNVRPRQVPQMNADVTELRLALVCDGGVSLAIYIHGVTKELQNVVTASRTVDRVREGESRETARQRLTPAQVAYFDALETCPTPMSVVIDVISGTSAGGINGVCLAKALSRGLSQDSMTAMWLDRADLTKLTHRHPPGLWGAVLATAAALPWHVFKRGWSPLDGNRMCQWLLQALGSMDPRPTTATTQGLLPPDHTLDLFVTTTDLRGYQKVYPSPDGGKGEHDRNNRKVFHFTSATPGTESRFGPGDNPALAFAARCSSSFPGAFAPVHLAGFATIAAQQGIAFDAKGFAAEHLGEYGLVGDDPSTIYFVDGGLLDNSPFDHTITAIAAKSAEGPVDRRIVHIDPDPGQWSAASGDQPAEQQAPTWAGGVKSALGVQSSQSLVRDLDDLQELNQTIGSVGAITSELREQVDSELRSITGSVGKDPTWEDAQVWSSAVHTRVPALAGTINISTYQRLKVAAIADMIGGDLAGVLGYPPGTQQADFVRSVFTVWFSRPGSLPNRNTAELAELLDDVDLPYRERRLRFLIAGVNSLFSKPATGVTTASLRDLKGHAWQMLNALLDFRATTARSLNGERLAFLSSTAIRGTNPAAFVDAKADDLSGLFNDYREKLSTYSRNEYSRGLWNTFLASTARWPVDTQRELLGRHLGFPLWDALIYPVIALSKLPQLTPVKLQRISPSEATLLYPVNGAGEPKLRGTAVAHFGGFFDREWRENDYLWGRLDTAEILLAMIGHRGWNTHSIAAFQAILDTEGRTLTTLSPLIANLRDQLRTSPRP